MKKINERQLHDLQSALNRMKVPREISDDLLDPDNINRTYNAFVTNTLLLNRDQWVIDFATLQAHNIEDASDELRGELLGHTRPELLQNETSKRLDAALTEGQTEFGITRQRVKRVSLDVEANDLYVLKGLADKQNVSIGTLIRQAIKVFIT